jgi:hypothetical protein
MIHPSLPEMVGNGKEKEPLKAEMGVGTIKAPEKVFIQT